MVLPKLLMLGHREALLHKIVFELKFSDGELYYDRAGRVIRLVRRDSTEWVASRPGNGEITRFSSTENGCQFTFTARKLDGIIEQSTGGEPLTEENAQSFADQMSTISEAVLTELAISQVVRIGCRIWYLFKADSKTEGAEWIRDLGFCHLAPTIEGQLGVFEDLSVSAVYSGEDRKYRLGIETVERADKLTVGNATIQVDPRSLPKKQRQAYQAKLKEQRRKDQNPEFAASIDVDCYLEDPSEYDVKDFILTSLQKCFPAVSNIVEK